MICCSCSPSPPPPLLLNTVSITQPKPTAESNTHRTAPAVNGHDDPSLDDTELLCKH